ncbi:MAG TPA: hypothetical protein VFQ54_01845 [Thermomicrobiales bacterium]|nr:hypothetical protein [Thermomicrobiales bacterium]
MNDATRDSIEMIAGVPLVLVLPALVELVKQQGVPARWAGISSIAIATFLVAVGDLALGNSGEPGWLVRAAIWIVQGIVYGLAAAGLYSQRELILPGQKTKAPPTSAKS